jgi:hypothetical protein
VKSVQWQGRDCTDRPFDATSGRDIDDVVVTFTFETAAIAGFVRDVKGQILTTGAVIAFPTDRTLWSRYGFAPSRIKSAPVSTNGQFTITPLPAGDYYVLAVDDAQATAWQDPAFLGAAAVRAEKATVGWGETRSVNLTLGGERIR